MKFSAQYVTKSVNDSRYQVVQILGQSRWTLTCRGLDHSQTPPRACVIKQVQLDDSLSSPIHIQQIEQTIRDRLQAVQHPQIPAWIDSFVDPSAERHCLYWVQDYIEGESLASLQKQETFGAGQIWEILASILPVLQHLHQHQIIHGDIKPANLICPTGTEEFNPLVLVDCALPNLLPVAGGNPEYAAPEQVQGQATFTSDLYSLGLTCLHLLTGLRPLTLTGLEQWSDFCPDLPSSLMRLLNRLTAPDPAQRYSSATTAIAALEQLRGQKLKPVIQPAPPWTCDATLSGHQGLFASVNAVAVSPDSAWIASASDDRTLRIWHLAGSELGREADQLVGHQGFVKAVAFHPSQPVLASAGQDRTIRLWNYQTGQLMQTLTGHSSAVKALAYSPDGVLASSDKTIKLWQTGECLVTLSGHRLAVNGLAFGRNPQGQLSLSSGSSDGTIRIWDLAAQTCRQILTGQAVRAVAVSPTRIASGGDDRVIQIWNWAGELVQTLPGHSWTVAGLAFTPDGNTLASASWDKSLKLWQVETGAELAVLKSHSDSVCAVCVSPDGQSLVSASQDKTLRIWRCTQT